MYAIMLNPTNRVYFESSKKLAIAELRLVINDEKLEITEQKIGGIDYLFVDADSKFLEAIFQLSFVYAVFEVAEFNGKIALIPIENTQNQYIDSGISSMLKYTGKTNEVFTRLMINIGAITIGKLGEKLTLLDPIAGKGTTLYEGLVKGYNVYGVEIGTKVAEESYRFTKKYLETARYKHSVKELKQSGANKSFVATRYSIDITKDKETKDSVHYEMVAGNTLYTDKFFKKDSFDLIVGDLPYGVQHSNVTNEKQNSFTRNPKELLAGSLPVWKNVLKANGALVLGWNYNVVDRQTIVELLEGNGYKVMNEGLYLEFTHRVDQAINRDIIVAVK